jgi:sugar fermentation stimulation protein A
MAYLGELVVGRLAQRDNRFRATVLVDGVAHKAHVPNSGRLGELLTPGAVVHLRPAARAGRVTAYDLVLVEHRQQPVCIDARWPPRLIREAWEWGDLAPFAGYDTVMPEVRCGESRLDLRFDSTRGDVCWVEAKSVTLVRGGVACFPDAPTARGRRHVEELTGLARQGIGAAVVFVVQRSAAGAFRPHDETDPAFGQALRAARSAGVLVLAYRCAVNPPQITILPHPLDLHF